jgi:hypothetical protein
MKTKNPARRYAVGDGVGNDALAHRGAVPKQHTTQSQAAQRAQGATEDAVVRPRRHRRILTWLAGRKRVVIRSKCKDDPVIVIEVDSSGGRS